MAAVALALSACGLALTGTGGSVEETSTRDAAAAGDAARVPGDASVPDDATVPDGDAASAPDGCPANSTTFTSGTLTVPPAASPVVIDGDLGDWKCARFFTYDAGTAASVVGTVPAANVYAFAVAWDPSYVYVAAHVLDSTTPRGTYTGNSNYENDAVEVYLGGDATYTTSYTSKDHQYVVDWANRAEVYTPGNDYAPPSGFTSAAKSSATGFDIEMRIPASEVGVASLTASTKLGFSFATDEGNGTNPHGWTLWYQPSGISCSGCCEPSCNAVYFGKLVLGP